MYVLPSIITFVPKGKTSVSAATVAPSTAFSPLAVIPSLLPQHFSQGQYAVITYSSTIGCTVSIFVSSASTFVSPAPSLLISSALCTTVGLS